MSAQSAESFLFSSYQEALQGTAGYCLLSAKISTWGTDSLLVDMASYCRGNSTWHTGLAL